MQEEHITKKTKMFWLLQGVCNENIGQKWVNSNKKAIKK